MRCSPVLIGLFLSAVISPALAQSNPLETSREAERRRQAEQYQYEKQQERRGNILNTEKPRGLGEAPPPSFSRPHVPAETDGRAGGCPSDQPSC